MKKKNIYIQGLENLVLLKYQYCPKIYKVNAVGITLPHFKIYNKATITKTV